MSYAPLDPTGNLVRTADNTVEFRDDFASGVSSTNWTVSTSGSVAVSQDGSAAGANYLRVTLDPRDLTARYSITGKTPLQLKDTCRYGFAVTQSRRVLGHQTWQGLAAVDNTGAAVTDGLTNAVISLTGGIVVASNVATATSTAPHNFKVGRRVAISGNADGRITGIYYVQSVPTTTTFTFTSSLANATYGTTSSAVEIPLGQGLSSVLAVVTDDSTSGNAKFVSRSNALPEWVTAWNPGSTWETASIASGVVSYSTSYTYAAQPRYFLDFSHEGDWAGVNLLSIDAGGVTSLLGRDQSVPFSSYGFVPRVDVRSLGVGYVPIRITSVSKSGTTTATVTAPSHGLVTGDVIVAYGVRDQTNFANLGGTTITVVDANTFTFGWGSAVTASSYGGAVYRTPNVTAPIVSSSGVQSIATSSTGRLLVTFLASQGSWVVGESVLLTGLVDSTNTAQTSYEGLYRVASTNTTTFQVELEALSGQSLPGSTINVGGLLQAAPDVKIHFVRGAARARMDVEIASSRTTNRPSSAAAVWIAGSNNNAVSTNFQQVASTTISSVVGASSTTRALGVNALAPTTNTDVSSAAKTSTGTSGAIAEDFGQAISALINVTAVSGTTPTLDIELQESDDNGTTWRTCYQCPRLTAVSTLSIPPMLMSGRRQWKWTLSGTSPSFTFSIVTMRSNGSPAVLRQLVDRSITPNTANSSSAALDVGGCKYFTVTVVSGAGATTAPVYGIQLSVDGTNWGDAGVSVTANASVTAVGFFSSPGPVRFARLYIKTAGVAATQTYATLTASG